MRDVVDEIEVGAQRKRDYEKRVADKDFSKTQETSPLFSSERRAAVARYFVAASCRPRPQRSLAFRACWRMMRAACLFPDAAATDCA